MRSLLWIVLALAFVTVARAETSPPEPLLKQGNARIVLVGDSITGQSRNHPAGSAHQIDWALQQAYPGCHPRVISLGGSGQGVQAWLNTEKRSRTDSFPLDVKGLGVKTELDQPCDVLVIMLGMNDVLAPYVVDEAASLEKWSANYRELITALQSRLKPKVTAVATATLCTEDITSPKNAIMDKLNRRLQELAGEMHLRVLPTNQFMRIVLERGRTAKVDFHVTHDFVHPNEAGHLAIAWGMLSGLGETPAADALKTKKLDPLLGALSLDANGKAPAGDTTAPAPWLVAAGLIRKPWNEHEPLTRSAFRGPIEEAIEQGGNFVAASDPITSAPLKWKPYSATVNYTGGANPDSVDFAAVTHARNFEAGYAARWIHSDRDRAVNVEVSTQTFAGIMEMNVWLNRAPIYSGLINAEPKKSKTVSTRLRAGWNTLVFCLNHSTWQMQCSVKLVPTENDSLDDLRYSISSPSAKPLNTP